MGNGPRSSGQKTIHVLPCLMRAEMAMAEASHVFHWVLWVGQRSFFVFLPEEVCKVWLKPLLLPSLLAFRYPRCVSSCTCRLDSAFAAIHFLEASKMLHNLSPTWNVTRGGSFKKACLFTHHACEDRGSLQAGWVPSVSCPFFSLDNYPLRAARWL